MAMAMVSCAAANGGSANSSSTTTTLSPLVVRAMEAAKVLPEELAESIRKAASEDPEFLSLIARIETGDSFLYRLVDKDHALPDGYEPEDLVDLTASSYGLGRSGLSLRTSAEASLAEMAKAARTDGVNLVVSSSYRSFDYQTKVYARVVAELGQEAADRESARPGRSQHQLGLVVDFGSIDDSFAETEASRWLLANAGKFGWSLSFPQGYEGVTGYRWESWHYRYVGRDLVSFIDTYFGGIQQYALLFLNEYVLGAPRS